MKLCVEYFDLKRSGGGRFGVTRGFSLVETVIAMALMVILVTTTLATILQMQVNSKRTADYISAMAIAEAKLMDIRAVYYQPPISPFTYATVYTTNQDSISLNQAGTTFQIPGTVVSKIDYEGAVGHLVTVTVTLKNSGKPVTATLQGVVNSYSGGQQ